MEASFWHAFCKGGSGEKNYSTVHRRTDNYHTCCFFPLPAPIKTVKGWAGENGLVFVCQPFFSPLSFGIALPIAKSVPKLMILSFRNTVLYKRVIPAKAGIQTMSLRKQGTREAWIPAYAGMTDGGFRIGSQAGYTLVRPYCAGMPRPVLRRARHVNRNVHRCGECGGFGRTP